MAEKNNYNLTPAQLAQISTILAKGDRVELCGGRDGVKVFQIHRKAF